MPFLRERLKPATAPGADHIAALIADLNSDSFVRRRQATAKLEQCLDMAAPALRELLAGKPSLEARRRAEALLGQLHFPGGERLRAVRAVEVLEHAGTAEARTALEALAGGAAKTRLTEDANAALRRLGARPEKK